MLAELKGKAITLFNKTQFQVKKYSPEILIGSGIICGIACVVTACKATTKLDEILGEMNGQLVKQQEWIDGNPDQEYYTKEDIVKDKITIYMQAGARIAKLYLLPAALGAGSIACVLSSHNIMKKRSAALTAAYTVLDTTFRKYRDRVVEKLGEDADKEFRYGIKEEKIAQTEIDENGKEKKVTKKANVIDSEEAKAIENYSEYARFFDEGSRYWEKDSEYNLLFLRSAQAIANDRLKADKYLFLNDVYEMLGIPKSRAGQSVGWIYDDKSENPAFDNYIDFGIYDINRAVTRDFVNGYERVILLDFNVDGPIIDRLWPEKEGKRSKK